MMRPAFGLACLLALATSALHAQDPMFGPQRSAWGPRLDTIGVSTATRVLWRGHDVGAGARASAALGIYGRTVTSAGMWHVSAIADAIAVDARRGSSRADAALEIGRLLEDCGTVLAAWGGGYWLDNAAGDDVGAEFGVRVSAIPIPFVPEVWPTVHLYASRALGPLEGTFLGGLIRQEVGIQQYAVRFEFGGDTDDAGGNNFSSVRWRAETGIAKGFGRWMAHAEGGAVRNAGATLGYGGAGLSFRF